MTDKLLAILGARYPLTELETGAFATVRAGGMKFTIRAFHAAGLGHVSVMRAVGFFGLMQMDTLIINPLETDLPLLSYDRIHAFGKDTLIVELYHTLLGEYDPTPLRQVAAGGADLADHALGAHWYDDIKLPESLSKRGKKALSPRFDHLAQAYLTAFTECTGTAVANQAEKAAKASRYVEGLLANGGPSTNVFKKAIGADATAELFRKYLFGTTQG